MKEHIIKLKENQTPMEITFDNTPSKNRVISIGIELYKDGEYIGWKNIGPTYNIKKGYRPKFIKSDGSFFYID